MHGKPGEAGETNWVGEEKLVKMMLMNSGSNTNDSQNNTIKLVKDDIVIAASGQGQGQNQPMTTCDQRCNKANFVVPNYFICLIFIWVVIKKTICFYLCRQRIF